MLLAFDTSSAACTVALFDGDGRCVASADEVIGRGHAERLMPLIAEVMAGRSAARILVGVGPGSFTGIRVAIAAAHGLTIGWNAKLAGMNSLALIAAGAGIDVGVAAAVSGGHGEIFVQQFDGRTLAATSDVINAQPADAARAADAALVLGSGAAALVGARQSGTAREAWPSAANALKLPQGLRSLDPRPVYARAPDARLPVAA
jgi:tRNA threonylcarbamoyl adenosine modification protein YeaZ